MEFQKQRELFWERGIVSQHSISRVKEMLKGLYTFTSIRNGKANQGDIVIINLKNEEHHTVSFSEYIKYFLLIDRIEVSGIYTNIYFSRKFFTLVVKKAIGMNTVV